MSKERTILISQDWIDDVVVAFDIIKIALEDMENIMRDPNVHDTSYEIGRISNDIDHRVSHGRSGINKINQKFREEEQNNG